MTEALDAMVKAMRNELFEQALAQVGRASCIAIHGETTIELRGTFDMEKVARAGLLAIKSLTEDVHAEGVRLDIQHEAAARSQAVTWIFEGMIDKVLA